ncbi:unnamed protein product [Prorocentrum cordatum]|uniref:USP domain-containing protein n=1 Tax=Prorocentrum cordatum TaxID=2364126 RepID=A0ABN9U7H6_9DINO|nr:unnamed protein product [Polarella glacialis]
MEAAALPRAFPNLGRWCWVNALLQALSSIDDSRWWAILAPEPQAPDLLAALAVALRWIGRRDAAAERRESVPPAHIMAALERGLEAECRLSPSAEQDVHEALLQVLEAAIDGLSRRELAAALRSRAAPATAGLSSWAPAWPWAAGALGWVAARAARRDFLALWEGTLEEARVCLACGFEKVDREPGRQAFRCLSLELPQAPAADLPAMLAAAYGGGATERLEEVVCAACSLEAALRRFRYAAARGSLAALAACRRLRACADMAGQPLEPELLAPLCPPGVAPPQLCRAPHLRTFRIALPPTILAIHLRRLVLSPWGGQAKAQARVRCPPTLLLASRRQTPPPYRCRAAGRRPLRFSQVQFIVVNKLAHV